MAVATFIVVSFALVLAGPAMAERFASAYGLGPAFEWGWKILQWPLIFVLVSCGIALVYYFAPDAEQDWIWLTPGSIVPRACGSSPRSASSFTSADSAPTKPTASSAA
jgi:membrane protein